MMALIREHARTFAFSCPSPEQLSGKMSTLHIPWVVVVVLLSVSYCQGYLCYTCQLSGGAVDFSCLEDPTNAQRTDCPDSAFCSTKLMLYEENKQLFSFGRHCSQGDANLSSNKTVIDSQFITYFTACAADLCNTGDGVLQSGGSESPGFGVPGLGNNRGSAATPAALSAATAAAAGVALALVGRRRA